MKRVTRERILRVGAVAVVVMVAATLTSCAGNEAASTPEATGASASSSPRTPSSPVTSPAAEGDQAWAGLVGFKDIRFRSGTAQDFVLRVVRGEWRASMVGADGSVHEDVLAVALRVTCPVGADGPLDLGKWAYLRLSDGRSRRSGHFPVAGQLRPVDPGKTGQGWLVFEQVGWDALRGNMQPPASRFQVSVGLGNGSAMGTAVWMVDAWGLQKGDARRVTLPVLQASVGYLVM